jgi:NADH-quinone oxidoreductase subunit J
MSGIGITISFWIIAILAVGLSIAAISTRHPLKSAFYLVGVFFASAAAYLLLEAPLIAVLQVLVYAGAIMVFIIFVIMYINLRPEELEGAKITAVKILSPIIAILICAVAVTMKYKTISLVDIQEGFGQVKAVSEVLYTRYAFAFEALSLLLLIAIIGAVVLAGKKESENKGAKS